MTTLLYMLLSFIPVLVYIFIIWLTTPWKSIDFIKAIKYFVTGIISIGILHSFFGLLPKWQEPVSHFEISTSIIILAFIQIALIEEITKFMSFNIGEKMNSKNKDNLPIGTMFYSGISALGFSFLENIHYAIRYGGDVIFVRSFTAMMLHFLCGMIMGYWIAASRIPSRFENRSLIEIIFIKKPLLKKISYSIIGILCATLLHGLYDYNIMSNGHIISNYIIMLGSVIAIYLASNDLTERYKNNL